MADFPTALTNAVDDVTDVQAKHINNVEAKIGIDGSVVATSLDYLTKNTNSIDPGHKHSKICVPGSGGEAVTVDDSWNLRLGGYEPGASAEVSISVSSGVAPTTAPENMVQMWVEDINAAAGFAGLHKRTETTNQKEIVPGVIIKTDTGSPANPYEGLLEINTFDNKIRMYADAGWRQLATW